MGIKITVHFVDSPEKPSKPSRAVCVYNKRTGTYRGVWRKQLKRYLGDPDWIEANGGNTPEEAFLGWAIWSLCSLPFDE